MNGLVRSGCSPVPWVPRAGPESAAAAGTGPARAARQGNGRDASGCTQSCGYRRRRRATDAPGAPGRPGRGRWRCIRCAGRPPGSCWCQGRSSRPGWARSGAAGFSRAQPAPRTASPKHAAIAHPGRPGPVRRRAARAPCSGPPARPAGRRADNWSTVALRWRHRLAAAHPHGHRCAAARACGWSGR